ncbi:nuclear transport factor 2 family protein [uncultured Piscinibacter sp.]|uniref:nuclear transport factor 2 family protein n=1 Tax=uncultured Piscinibacter sp. TaxID=1131835 RepID=UPI00260CE612|nr:nuclear transport factor 2 family protein [uncultured Piscinibacter sp.]
MKPEHEDARVARVVAMFESISAADVARLGDFYAGDARFKDPFNDVQGVPAIQRVFAHMFAALDEPRFVVSDIVVDGDQCFLTWDFLFRFKRFSRVPRAVHGSSHLRFDAQGRIALHRDYWDAAEELYEKLPLVGGLMRWLKRRANS